MRFDGNDHKSKKLRSATADVARSSDIKMTSNLFLFPHPRSVTFQELCETKFSEWNPKVRSGCSQGRRKLVWAQQQRYSLHLHPGSLNIFVRLPSLFIVPLRFKVETLLADEKKNKWKGEKKKKKSSSTSNWSCSGGGAAPHNESNHSEAKMEIFVSELIRQGISRPQIPPSPPPNN